MAILSILFIFSCVDQKHEPDTSENDCNWYNLTTITNLCVVDLMDNERYYGHFTFSEKTEEVFFETKDMVIYDVKSGVYEYQKGEFAYNESLTNTLIRNIIDAGEVIVVQRGNCAEEGGYSNAIAWYRSNETELRPTVYSSIDVVNFEELTVAVHDNTNCETYRNDECYEGLAQVQVDITVGGYTETVFQNSGYFWEGYSVIVWQAEISTGSVLCPDNIDRPVLLNWSAAQGYGQRYEKI